MKQADQLDDQLENLFSDLTVPEPQAPQEAAPEPSRDEPPRETWETPQPEAQPSRDEPPHKTWETPQPEAQPSELAAEPIPVEITPPELDSSQPRVSEEKGASFSARIMRRIKWLRQPGLRQTLILAFVAVAVIPSLIISAFGILSQVNRIGSNARDNLALSATLQENQIEQWIQSQTSAFALLAQEPSLKQQIRTFFAADPSASDYSMARFPIKDRLQVFLEQHPEFNEAFLLNADGQVVISTDSVHEGELENNVSYFVHGREESYYEPPVLVERWNAPSLIVAEPLRQITGEMVGVLVGFVKTEPLTQFMQEAPTGETYLVNETRLLITSLQGEEKPALGDPVTSTGIEGALAKNSGQGTYDNYAGQSVLGVYRWLPKAQIGLLTEQKRTEVYNSLFVAASGTAVVAAIAVVLTALLAGRIAQRITQPISQMTESAKQMVAGDLDQSVAIDRDDEIGDLGQAFNQMASQLRRTVASLEEKVTERTTLLQEANYQLQKRAIQLETSVQVSHAAASILDPQELMQTTVDLIRDRFRFYHVSIFLLDKKGEWAVVRASTGEVGEKMVAQPHRLATNSQSMVGWVCTHRQPRIALDVGADAVHFDNPLLPHTRSELTLPLRIGDRLLGVLDVQSVEEAAFDNDDVRALQGMADLVAIALENARLFTTTRQSTHYQRLISRISGRTQQAVSVADVLAQTVEELGETFDLQQATICLGTEAELQANGNDHSNMDGETE